MLVALLTGGAHAQSLDPGPPGPFVVDVRGVTAGLPADGGLYPGAAVGGTVPSRGLGVGVGGHIYVLPVGAVRLGLGVEATLVRGTGTDADLELGIVSPVLSLNFGTADGWSYLSAGVGAARVRPSPGTSLTVRALAVGGGARWFPWPHVGVGFDLRLHRLAGGTRDLTALPSTTLLSAGVGLSLK